MIGAQRIATAAGEGARANMASDSPWAKAALEWLGLDQRARLIVSADLRVRWHNLRAAECLSHRAGVNLRDGAITFGTPAVQRAFAAFVAGLGDELRTLAIPSEGDILLLRGWRTRAAGETLACIEVIRDNADFTCQYRDIDVVFCLTPAEHGVVLRSLSGHTATATACALGLSVDTVRTHIRHIYSKLGVRSREELLGRLAPYRVL